jgi:hypothetical protein
MIVRRRGSSGPVRSHPWKAQTHKRRKTTGKVVPCATHCYDLEEEGSTTCSSMEVLLARITPPCRDVTRLRPNPWTVRSLSRQGFNCNSITGYAKPARNTGGSSTLNGRPRDVRHVRITRTRGRAVFFCR